MFLNCNCGDKPIKEDLFLSQIGVNINPDTSYRFGKAVAIGGDGLVVLLHHQKMWELVGVIRITVT